MRGVTDGAIFLHRRVLPQERSALLVMAAEAKIDDGRGFDHMRAVGPMRIVTVGTGHHAFDHRVMGRPQVGGALFGMAGETHRRLGLFGEHRVFHRMRGVAAGASDVGGGVRTALPMGRGGGFVTAQALLIAIRDMGEECPVEALSEGARDQLYLALRIAAVETYAAQAEPLPFIADDLLVHFDDTRAAAAIALLADLGRTTQVILFTHHDHVVALAERQPGVGVQALPPIPVGHSAVLAVT